MEKIKELKEQCDYLESQLQSEIENLRNCIDDLECELIDMLSKCETVDDFKMAINKVLDNEPIILKNENGETFILSMEYCRFNEDNESEEN